MRRLPTEEEKKLRDIFKPYINGYNEKQPLTSDAPPEAVEAFEKWKELSLRLDKEAEALFFWNGSNWRWELKHVFGRAFLISKRRVEQVNIRDLLP